jgi:murein DD-endopeptidase MepM/ murein hydrolase activator NlpD
MPYWKRSIWALAVVVTLSSCTYLKLHAPLDDHAPSGTWYLVRAGDTPVTIAERAGIPLEDFLEANGLRRDETLEPGRIVFVLRPERPGDQGGAGTPREPSRFAPPAQAVFRWPIKAPILTSPFGARWGRMHEGIDMAARIGTPVLAAGDGVVLYSGDRVRGYGLMVVLQHADDLVTVYAHNSALRVKTGEKVRAGQEIALAGDSGRSTAPHLHFEVRRGDSPQDPIPFLPPLK